MPAGPLMGPFRKRRRRAKRARSYVSGTASVRTGYGATDDTPPKYRPAVVVAGFTRPLEARADEA
jgi:hypothetical protein